MENLVGNLFNNAKVNADVAVNVSFDPLSSLLLALFVMIAIILSHVAVKAIL